MRSLSIVGMRVGSAAYVGAMAASIVGQAAVGVSGPATARLLGPEGRGELALMAILVVLGASLITAGLPNAVAYTIARQGVSARSVLRLIGRLWLRLAAVAAAMCIVALVLLASRRPASSLPLEAPLVALWCVSTAAWALLLACLQGERRLGVLNWLRPLAPVVSAAGTLSLLLAVHHASVVVVLTVLVACSTAALLAGIWVGTRHLRDEGPAPAASTRPLLQYGLRSLIGANAPVEAYSLDQAAVALFLSTSQLGIYVVATAFDNLPSLLVFGLGTIALPRLAAERDDRLRRRRLFRLSLWTVGVASLTTMLAEILVGILLPLLFGSAFLQALPVARVLIIAGFFLALRRMLVVFLQALGRPGRTTIAEIAAIAALFVFATVLIPPFGLLGAAAALLLAAVASTAYLVWTLRDFASDGHVLPAGSSEPVAVADL